MFLTVMRVRQCNIEEAFLQLLLLDWTGHHMAPGMGVCGVWMTGLTRKGASKAGQRYEVFLFHVRFNCKEI